MFGTYQHSGGVIRTVDALPTLICHHARCNRLATDDELGFDAHFNQFWPGLQIILHACDVAHRPHKGGQARTVDQQSGIKGVGQIKMMEQTKILRQLIL